MAVATHLEVKNLGAPDETRPYADKGKFDLVQIADVTIGRAVFKPGWRWSQHVKPIVGTESCEVLHAGYIESGRMHVRMDDGSETEVGPGDAFIIPPGHDAWTVGDETCTFLDFGGLAGYAQR